jgi:hypothetical protein
MEELCIKHYLFLILTVDGEWLSSRLCRFILRERSASKHLIGGMGVMNWAEHCGEEKNPISLPIIEHCSSIV